MAGAAYGGAEAFFARLVPSLQQAGVFQHAVIRRHSERAAALEAAGVPTTQLRFGGPLDLPTRWKLRHAIKSFRPDILVSWMNRATAACPRGSFVHVGRLGGYYDPKYYSACDHLIANTIDLVGYLVGAGFSRDRVHYVPNFVPAPAKPEDDQRAVVRASLQTPLEAPVVVALGRLHRNKAFDVLLKAMADLPDVYLWLAGAGPEADALMALAVELGITPRISFLGWRDDPSGILGAADVFVCPSRHEPLGNVVLEAWAHGVPAVAAASQGPRQLIRDGETGLLVAVDDWISLAAAIRRLINDATLANELAVSGHQVWERDFSEPAVVGQWLAFLRTIADPSGSGGSAGKPDGTVSCAA